VTTQKACVQVSAYKESHQIQKILKTMCVWEITWLQSLRFLEKHGDNDSAETEIMISC